MRELREGEGKEMKKKKKTIEYKHRLRLHVK